MAINYPNKKISYNKETLYANRGMSLEKELNESNKYYRAHGIALIHKKPTPVQIVKVDYPKRASAVIKEAYFRQPSTTDYNGIYKGKHIDFEAKETSSKTAFPLQNIHKHQIEHIQQIINLGGISFVIIRFKKLNKTYLMDGQDIVHFYNSYLKDGRKSLSIKTFMEKGYEIEQKLYPKLDYLKVVNSLYFGAK
ncbi:Holliday junction resolvase RecU [Haloplasma contractile]|uniref:Holliday junction resolvase RecU n=1 Tax=Haloplasma contractile SSD-17B TaxID=1033810 RepID=U2DZG0_9MOLU|nr:Holliday junction resolvase RecU [Haloplasma contractile]ERJ13587.1 Holliday junction resolvase RecU protein [Haloplasma contractile SSD-17B]